jgi:hypothetical protein
VSAVQMQKYRTCRSSLLSADQLRHHANLALPDDPDCYKYITANKATRLSYRLAPPARRSDSP